MNHELLTCIVMAFCCTSAGLLDWWLGANYGKEATMTCLIRRVTKNNMWLEVAIVLAFGMMIGHFFLWPDCSQLQQPQ